MFDQDSWLRFAVGHILSKQVKKSQIIGRKVKKQQQQQKNKNMKRFFLLLAERVSWRRDPDRTDHSRNHEYVDPDASVRSRLHQFKLAQLLIE